MGSLVQAQQLQASGVIEQHERLDCDEELLGWVDGET